MTILVVDDDDISRELLQLLLTREGYCVHATASGDDALILLEGRTSVDIVLADLQMPGLTGTRFVQQLRALADAPRVILAMSGSQPAADLTAVFDGFLLKPFTMKALAAAIQAEDEDIVSAGGAANRSSAPGRAILDSSAILNLEIYGRLKASMKPEKLAQLYDLCLDDVARRVAGMRVSASKGDEHAYRSEAHAIMGGCGLLGALELQSIAASGEDEGIPTNYVATIEEIMAAAERLKRMLIGQRNHI